MNQPDNTPESDFTPDSGASVESMSAFLPLTLLAASLIVVLGWQVSTSSNQRGLLQQGIENRAPVLQQARQTQAGLQKLVIDLIEASKDDNEAISVIAKYNVQIGGKPVVTAGSPPPAASPSATPKP
ncbi:MAG: hypothetical protein WCP06_12980 [Verrucomicrobiota bacterium]